MENGAFLAGISIARDLGMLVELAIATDGLVIVFIMGVLVRAVQKQIGTTAVGALASLKETAATARHRRGAAVSVIVILLVPLAAALLVCIPLGKRWVPGVTVVSCLADLILIAQLARQVVAGNGPGELLDACVVQVDRRGWPERTDLAAHRPDRQPPPPSTPSATWRMGISRPRKLRLYHANYNLFIFSMLAIPVLAEPTLVWIVVELTTLCSALLVSFENTREALEAAWKYVGAVAHGRGGRVVRLHGVVRRAARRGRGNLHLDGTGEGRAEDAGDSACKRRLCSS